MTINVLQDILSMGYQPDEIVPALRSLMSGLQEKSRKANHIEYGGSQGEYLEIVVKDDHVTEETNIVKVNMDSSLWTLLQSQLQQAENNSISKVTRTILYSNKELDGYVNVDNWIQLRPTLHNLEVNEPYNYAYGNAVDYPVPTVVETFYKSTELGFLIGHRRSKAVKEACWFISAFVTFPLYSLNENLVWIQKEATDNTSYMLARHGMNTGFENADENSFSDVSALQPLQFEQTQSYFHLIHMSRLFSVPNLKQLYDKFLSLDDRSKRQFTRACAYMFTASNPNFEYSLKIAAYVNAIESLLTGINGKKQKFKTFVDTYVPYSPKTQHYYHLLYHWRSKIAHGSWHLQVDEPMFGWTYDSHLMSNVASSAAKQGIINWLLAQP